MRWVEIVIEASEAAVDAVSGILMDEGCGGTAVTQIVDTASQNLTDVAGYLPVDDRLEDRLQKIRERITSLPELGLELRSDEITVKFVEEEEWATAWKKYFKPIVMGHIIIKPSWEEYEASEGEIIIDIDPGMAFGTGNHPTTMLCILALQDYIKGGETVLDMGTGSGILAMAAAKLGAAKVVGLDIDTVAVEAAAKNVERVGLTDIITIGRGESPAEFEGQSDIVVANILATVIIDMAVDLRSKLKPGGILIASGIIDERAPDVSVALEATGLKFLSQRVEGDWVALVLEAPKE